MSDTCSYLCQYTQAMLQQFLLKCMTGSAIVLSTLHGQNGWTVSMTCCKALFSRVCVELSKQATGTFYTIGKKAAWLIVAIHLYPHYLHDSNKMYMVHI